MSIFTFPIGSQQDVPFFDQDLLNVGLEFPQEPGAYFANSQQTVICIPSLLNPAVQWCSTKAETWTPQLIGSVVINPPVPPYVPSIHPVATPEPSMFLILAVAFAAIFARRKN